MADDAGTDVLSMELDAGAMGPATEQTLAFAAAIDQLADAQERLAGLCSGPAGIQGVASSRLDALAEHAGTMPAAGRPASPALAPPTAPTAARGERREGSARDPLSDLGYSNPLAESADRLIAAMERLGDRLTAAAAPGVDRTDGPEPAATRTTATGEPEVRRAEESDGGRDAGAARGGTQDAEPPGSEAGSGRTARAPRGNFGRLAAEYSEFLALLTHGTELEIADGRARLGRAADAAERDRRRLPKDLLPPEMHGVIREFAMPDRPKPERRPAAGSAERRRTAREELGRAQVEGDPERVRDARVRVARAEQSYRRDEHLLRGPDWQQELMNAVFSTRLNFGGQAGGMGFSPLLGRLFRVGAAFVRENLTAGQERDAGEQRGAAPSPMATPGGRAQVEGDPERVRDARVRVARPPESFTPAAGGSGGGISDLGARVVTPNASETALAKVGAGGTEITELGAAATETATGVEAVGAAAGTASAALLPLAMAAAGLMVVFEAGQRTFELLRQATEQASRTVGEFARAQAVTGGSAGEVGQLSGMGVPLDQAAAAANALRGALGTPQGLITGSRLGLDFQLPAYLTGGDNAGLLRQAIESMRAIHDPQERFRELSGLPMLQPFVPAINAGEPFYRQNQDLGRRVGKLATPEAIEAGANFDLAKQQWSQVTNGLLTAIAAPILGPAAEGLQHLETAIVKLSEALEQHPDGARWLGKMAEAALDWAAKIVTVAAKGVGALESFAEGAETWLNRIIAVVNFLKDLTPGALLPDIPPIGHQPSPQPQADESGLPSPMPEDPIAGSRPGPGPGESWEHWERRGTDRDPGDRAGGAAESPLGPDLAEPRTVKSGTTTYAAGPRTGGAAGPVMPAPAGNRPGIPEAPVVPDLPAPRTAPTATAPAPAPHDGWFERLDRWVRQLHLPGQDAARHAHDDLRHRFPGGITRDLTRGFGRGIEIGADAVFGAPLVRGVERLISALTRRHSAESAHTAAIHANTAALHRLVGALAPGVHGGGERLAGALPGFVSALALRHRLDSHGNPDLNRSLTAQEQAAAEADFDRSIKAATRRMGGLPVFSGR